MKIFNCHSHTRNSLDSEAVPEKMTAAAVNCGLFGYAITDHIDCDPCMFDYNDAIIVGTAADAAEQKRLHPEIKIFSGVEVAEAILSAEYEKRVLNAKDWDIVMGSIHSVQMEGWTQFFSGIDFTSWDDELTERYLLQYFSDLEQTAKYTDYDSLSHLTVPLRYIIHKYGKKVDMSVFEKKITSILQAVIERGKSLELNTSGYCGSDPFFMPDEVIMKKYLSLGGTDFTIGSDAHLPEKMGCGLDAGIKLLLSLGVTRLNYYEKRKKISYNILEDNSK